MIKIILIVLAIGAVLFVALPVYWVKSMSAGYTLIDEAKGESYFHKEGLVYYTPGGNFFEIGATLMEGADLATFEVLGQLYARDKHRVYYREEVIPDVDAASFQLITEIYARDKTQVFYLKKLISGADPDTFKLIWDSYAEDKNHLYYNDTWLSELLPNTKFDRITGDTESKFLRYGNRLYRGEQLLTQIRHPASFHLLDDDYSSDGKNIYYQLKHIPNADAASFQNIESFYGKDNTHVYLYGNILIDVAPDQFDVSKYRDDKLNDIYYIGQHHVTFMDSSIMKNIDDQGPFRTDGQYVYAYNSRIEGADLNSFSIIEENFSRDQQHIYYTSKRLLDAKPESFRILENQFSRDEHHLYWQDIQVVDIKPDQFIYEPGMWAEETEPGKGRLVMPEPD